ncbi:MAG: hypothetical protein RR645_02170 [Clostridium sp.]
MKKKILLILLFMFITSPIALAKDRNYEKGDISFNSPHIIEKHKISNLFNGELIDKNDVDFVKFKGEKGDEFYIEMRVPITKKYKNDSPSMALISNNIIQKDKVPFSLPEKSGVILINASTYYKEYKEPYTFKKYNIAQTIRGEIPDSGEYFIAIFGDNGGKYTLKTGERESATIFEILRFPFTYIRLNYFFEPVGTIIKGSIIIIFIIGSIFIARKIHSIIIKKPL